MSKLFSRVKDNLFTKKGSIGTIEVVGCMIGTAIGILSTPYIISGYNTLKKKFDFSKISEPYSIHTYGHFKTSFDDIKYITAHDTYVDDDKNLVIENFIDKKQKEDNNVQPNVLVTIPFDINVEGLPKKLNCKIMSYQEKDYKLSAIKTKELTCTKNEDNTIDLDFEVTLEKETKNSLQL
jgi:hypothetical protein